MESIKSGSWSQEDLDFLGLQADQECHYMKRDKQCFHYAE